MEFNEYNIFLGEIIMAFSYWYELTVGVLTLIALLIIGENGFIFHISFSDFANLSNLTIFISASIFMILISILKLFYYYKN